MDQPGHREIRTINNEDGRPVLFPQKATIAVEKTRHPLRVFTWWAFNIDTGEAEEV